MTKTTAPFVIAAGGLAEQDDRRDRELFRLLAGGDSGALGGIYDRHAPSLFRHAVALTRRTADAEDLVQAAFVKLATAGALVLGVRRPAGYLHRMLHATWIDIVRRRELASEEAVEADVVQAATVDPDEMIALRRALERLPEAQREVVVLHVFDGFSFREIGNITRVSTFTAGSRYRLAIERLRLLLGER